MRKHVTYANVAATLALVFAMSAGALAATRMSGSSWNFDGDPRLTVRR
jgi:hypothetical protein